MARVQALLREFCNREGLHDAVAARRADQARKHNVLSPATCGFLHGILHTHLLAGGPGPGGPPRQTPSSSPSCSRVTKAAITWERYVQAIRPWFEHAGASGTQALPAAPVPFACWLAAAGERDRGYAQRKMRSVTISELSALVGVASPETGPRRIITSRHTGPWHAAQSGATEAAPAPSSLRTWPAVAAWLGPEHRTSHSFVNIR